MLDYLHGPGRLVQSVCCALCACNPWLPHSNQFDQSIVCGCITGGILHTLNTNKHAPYCVLPGPANVANLRGLPLPVNFTEFVGYIQVRPILCKTLQLLVLLLWFVFADV